MMNYNARVVRSGLNRHLRTTALLRLRLLSPLITYFVISVRNLKCSELDFTDVIHFAVLLLFAGSRVSSALPSIVSAEFIPIIPWLIGRYSFGDSGFIIIWMVNWMGMCAL